LIEHTIRVRSRTHFGASPRPDIVAPILAYAPQTLQNSLRMFIAGTSQARGRPWKEIEKASDIRFKGISSGKDDSTILHFAAPTLWDAAPRFFGQLHLMEEQPDTSLTAFDITAQAIKQIARRDRDGTLFDSHLLGTFKRFRTPLGKKIDSFTIEGNKIPEDSPAVIDRELIRSAEALLEATPIPQRARIQGKLDMIRISDCVFELVLEDGSRVRSILIGSEITSLALFLNKGVVVEGDAVFRPSGSLLRIDAEAISYSVDSDRFFSKLPIPRPTVPKGKLIHKINGHTKSFASIFGAWPGDETDEEILALLAEAE